MENKDITELWTKIFNIVKQKSDNAVGLNVHMKDAVPVSIDNTAFTISVPMSINKNMIQFRYKDFIESAIEQVTAQRLSLNIILKGEEPKEAVAEDKSVYGSIFAKYSHETGRQRQSHQS